jgi:prophage maintenance system killer protein
MRTHDDDLTNERISKTDLPRAKPIQQINLMFMMDAKKGVRSPSGEKPIYNLSDKSFHQMKMYLLKLPAENVGYIEKIMLNFPEKSAIHEQCAYYMRAFSRAQIFPDANHRTGFFSLARILEKKGINIEADAQEITALFEYIKGQGWMEQGEMMVNLREKDAEYRHLCNWFRLRLKFR